MTINRMSSGAIGEEVASDGRKYPYNSGINTFTHFLRLFAPTPAEDQLVPASLSVLDTHDQKTP
jgi:hypothetical protein